MKTEKPKILHTVGGKPLLYHAIDALKGAGANDIVVVCNPELLDTLSNPNELSCQFVYQEEPKGTGHAVQKAISALKSDYSQKDPHILIMCADTPLITSSTLKFFMDHNGKDEGMLATMPIDPSSHYGRVVTTDHHTVCDIVEFKDATDEQRRIPLGNAGIYFLKLSHISSVIHTLTAHNAAGEYYLTDIVKLLHDQGVIIKHHILPLEETIGVNTLEDLAHAEAIFQQRKRREALSSGVFMQAPETVYFYHDTQIAPNVMIAPHVYFGKGVKIDAHAQILPYCHIENSHIKSHAIIGPFARLRQQVVIEPKAEVGNFVELKATHLHEKAKVKHLSYLGDCSVGERANIGAGTITCNYDGYLKHKTIIEDEAFIGSNTILIAPVKVSKQSYIAAGSTITKDVPQGSLAIARSHQTIKDNWAEKKRKEK